LTEYYRSRGASSDDDKSLPEISDILMVSIKGMMASSARERMTLDEVMSLGPVGRIGEMEGVEAALVEEDIGFLNTILA